LTTTSTNEPWEPTFILKYNEAKDAFYKMFSLPKKTHLQVKFCTMQYADPNDTNCTNKRFLQKIKNLICNAIIHVQTSRRQLHICWWFSKFKEIITRQLTITRHAFQLWWQWRLFDFAPLLATHSDHQC